MKRPQLRLRDFFWLMLVAAICVGWWLNHLRWTNRITELAAADVAIEVADEPIRSADAKSLRATIKKLGKLSDMQLSQRLRQLQEDRLRGAREEFAPCLAEMARRGLRDELQLHYEKLMSREQPQGRLPDNLEMLTALRRAQGQPDPLRIRAELRRRDDVGKPSALPMIRATIENVDVGKESVLLVDAADDGHGRRETWRVHLTDKNGRRVPESTAVWFGGSGTLGLATLEPLAFGEQAAHGKLLDARSYVKAPPPGKYRLQLFYSRRWPADEQRLEGLIVLESEPVSVIVEYPDRQEIRKSPIVPIAILGILGIGVIGIGVRRFSPRRNASEPISFAALWRDLLGLVLVVVLTLGWLFDNQRLAREAMQLQPAHETNWTMRLAE